MKWAGHVARMGERHVYTVLVEKPGRKEIIWKTKA
jgi:hypothetical protein